MKLDNVPSVVVLYGSQTGQSESIAEIIEEKLSDGGIDCGRYELNEIGRKFKLENERVAVIVCSSTGDGDPPENAAKFYRRIQRTSESGTPLSHFRFALLGLGDSNYTSFLQCPKRIEAQLLALGATPFYESGFADDQVGTELVAEPWMDGLLPAVKKALRSADAPAESIPSENVSFETKCSVENSSKLLVKVVERSFDQNGPTTIAGNDSNIRGNLSKAVSVSGHENQNYKHLTASEPTDKIIEDKNLRASDLLNENTISDFDIRDVEDRADRVKLKIGNDEGREIVGNDNTVAGGNAVELMGKKFVYKKANKDEPLKSNGVDKYSAQSATPVKEVFDKAVCPLFALLRLIKMQTMSDSEDNSDNNQRCTCEDNGGRSDSTGICSSSLRAIEIPLGDVTTTKSPPPFLQIKFQSKGSSLNLGRLEQERCSEPPAGFTLAASPAVRAELVSRKILTATNAGKQKYEIWLRLPDNPKIEYEPGDAFYVVCPNPDQEVSALLYRLGLEDAADIPCHVELLTGTTKKNAKVPPHLPSTNADGNCRSLREILRSCVDIRRPPSKTLLRMLADCSAIDNERNCLRYLCSVRGTETYIQRVVQQRLSLLDVLHAFPNCRPPVERLLEYLPRLQPRPYSVASYRPADPCSIRFVYTLVKTERCGDRFYDREGLCTGWITRLPIYSKVDVFLKKPTRFRFTDFAPESLLVSKPLIMIGPGAGIAPFLGFLDKLRHLEQADSQAEPVPPGERNRWQQRWLFFGCRSKYDYIFRDEQQSFAQDGSVTHHRVSFSRMNSTDLASPFDMSSPQMNKRNQNYDVSASDDVNGLRNDNNNLAVPMSPCTPPIGWCRAGSIGATNISWHTGYVQDALRHHGSEVCRLVLGAGPIRYRDNSLCSNGGSIVVGSGSPGDFGALEKRTTDSNDGYRTVALSVAGGDGAVSDVVEASGFQEDGELERFASASSLIEEERSATQQCGPLLSSTSSTAEQATVYVCGDANGMAKDVLATFVDLLQIHAGLSQDEAKSYMNKMQEDGRYLQDIWS
jgi:sulfite reductase alpha subunit-like flavoprotein